MCKINGDSVDFDITEFWIKLVAIFFLTIFVILPILGFFCIIAVMWFFGNHRRVSVAPIDVVEPVQI